MSIIENAKSVVKLVQQIDNIELYKQILDLKDQIFDLVEENRNMRDEVRSLQEKLRTKESLKFHFNAYWKENQDGTRDGPFCSKCWDKEEKLVRMVSCPNPQYHECSSCKQPLNTSGQPDRPQDIKVETRFNVFDC
jgi:regulator of replication initiation timing